MQKFMKNKDFIQVFLSSIFLISYCYWSSLKSYQGNWGSLLKIVTLKNKFKHDFIMNHEDDFNRVEKKSSREEKL